jgi:hypothetical protein
MIWLKSFRRESKVYPAPKCATSPAQKKKLCQRNAKSNTQITSFYFFYFFNIINILKIELNIEPARPLLYGSTTLNHSSWNETMIEPLK